MGSLEELAAQLHGELAKQLLARVSDGEATAAEMNVARQFLKDNGIDSVARKGSNLHKLAEVLPFDEDEIDPPTVKEA